MAKKQRKAKGHTDITGGTKPRLKRNPNASLPGIEDHAIAPLEAVAAEYAEIRDKRQELTRDEVALKGETLKLMKRYGKTIYRHGGVLITVVLGDENVKVKIKKPGETDATSLDDDDKLTANSPDSVNFGDPSEPFSDAPTDAGQ